MADDGALQRPPTRPRPKFHFIVTFDNAEMQFADVSGLDASPPPASDRGGDTPAFLPTPVRGGATSGTLTMQRGMFIKGGTPRDWFNRITLNTMPRKALTIALMNETGKALKVWTAQMAYPVKMSDAALMADGNEMAVERIEFAHDGLTVTNG